MTEDPYQRYLAEFGERVEAAAQSPRPARRRWLAGAAVAAAAVVALGVFLAAPGGDSKVNVIAEARAALPESGELLHLSTVSTSSLIGADEAAQERFDDFARRHHDDYAPRYFEQWSAGDRWRVANPANRVSPKMFAKSFLKTERLRPVR